MSVLPPAPARRDLRALDVLEVVPAGCFGVLVIGEEWAPHIRPGELAIVDPTDTTPHPGELYAIGRQGIDRDQTRIVQIHRTAPGTVRPGAVAFHHQLRRLGVMRLMDGPLSGEGWASRCRGRVVGVVPALKMDGR